MSVCACVFVCVCVDLAVVRRADRAGAAGKCHVRRGYVYVCMRARVCTCVYARVCAYMQFFLTHTMRKAVHAACGWLCLYVTDVSRFWYLALSTPVQAKMFSNNKFAIATYTV